MRNVRTTSGLLLALALCTLAGCFSLSRETPRLEQYVLGTGPLTEGAAASPDSAGLMIGLRRLDLAAYLAVPGIVVRRGTHEIVLSEFHRWAEEPGAGINRAVAAHLAGLAPVRAVDLAPWPVRSRYAYLIQLHVSRFEGVAPEDPAATEGEAHVLASWEIIRQQDEAVLARGVTDYREGGWQMSDYAGLVGRLDAGLVELARDLAACLQGPVSARVNTTDAVASPAIHAPALCGRQAD